MHLFIFTQTSPINQSSKTKQKSSFFFLLLVFLLQNMCASSHNVYFSMQNMQPKRGRTRRLARRRNLRHPGKEMMVLKNLKLVIQNMSILQENERLRKKASLLHQENLKLMSQIQKKFPGK